jgi:hypothetical protein
LSLAQMLRRQRVEDPPRIHRIAAPIASAQTLHQPYNLLVIPARTARFPASFIHVPFSADVL